MRSLEDLKSWWKLPNWGSCETAGGYWWRLVPQEVRLVTVRRPVEQVVESLARMLPFDRQVMTREMVLLDRKLDQLESRRDVLRVDYPDLEGEAACSAIFEWCLGLPHDHDWWTGLAPMNLQINLLPLVQYSLAYGPQMRQMAGLAKQEILQALRAKPVPSLEGITIAQEPFERWYTDGQRCFAEHLKQVGEPVDNYSKKNLGLLKELDDRGELQILVARSNGRVLGYMVALIAPSLESPLLTSALHTTFFVCQDGPRGLGMRLQKASIEALRARGVGEVLFRAGTRGSGPKMGALYKRLGAAPFGDLYRLPLGA